MKGSDDGLRVHYRLELLSLMPLLAVLWMFRP